jgi:hypothetical protein
MERLEYRRIVPLEILAASLAMRLSVDELEWLLRELAQRTEAERREEAQREQGEPPVPATYREAWDPMRGNAPQEAMGQLP